MDGRERIDLRGLAVPLVHRTEFAPLVFSILDATSAEGAFVEIGVRRAGMTRVLLQVLNRLGQERLVVSIDPADGVQPWWEKRGRDHQGACQAIFYPDRSQDVGAVFDDPVAWCFVDGCHCFDCVYEDIEAWGPRISRGGLLLFHDSAWWSSGQRKGARCEAGRTRRCAVWAAVESSPVVQDLFEMVDQIEDGEVGNTGLRIYRRREDR